MRNIKGFLIIAAAAVLSGVLILQHPMFSSENQDDLTAKQRLGKLLFFDGHGIFRMTVPLSQSIGTFRQKISKTFPLSSLFYQFDHGFGIAPGQF